MRTRSVLLAAGLALLLLLGVQAGLVLSASPMDPVRAESLETDGARVEVDAQYEVARAFAPWIFHETDSERGRADIPAAMDFDGDLDPLDAWEDMPRFELVPTVYYTVVETATHYVVSYHLYHPRDWSVPMLGVQDTHEGDGENVQVVVEKERMEAVILSTQAHYEMWSYAPFRGGIHSGEQTIRADFELIVGHPAVYVGRGGHGILGSMDPRAANRLARVGEPILTYTPPENASNNADAREPPMPYEGSHPYRLVSLPAFLANDTRHPDLFAKYVGDTPRYHKGDRYSGPLGNSRGISPFALGYGWSERELGSLFWEPGDVYADSLSIKGNWSREVIAHPFEQEE